MNNFLLSFLCGVLLVVQATNGHCEFYEFIDKNGVKTFTDKKKRIPPSKKKDIQVHKGRYDDLSAEERKARLKADQEKRMELRKKQEENRQRYEPDKLIREIKEAEIKRKKQLETKNTPVTISNNQILVPVTIGYLNKTVQTTLLLDTGANRTVLHTDVADRLKVSTGRKGSVEVAGGGTVPVEFLEVKFIQVGSKYVPSPIVTVMDYSGSASPFNGLLGLDFLKNFKYEIDYENSLIIWK